MGASPKRLRALLEAYADRVARAPEGTRHNTLIAYARAAGGLLPHGLDPLEAEEALVGAAMQAGLPEREAREAARWGLNVGRSAPIDLGDLKGGAFYPPINQRRVVEWVPEGEVSVSKFGSKMRVRRWNP